MVFENFIFASRAAASKGELFSVYRALMGQYGFDQLAYVITGNHPDVLSEQDYIVVKKSSLQGWDEHYSENEYALYDYINKYCRQSDGVLSWRRVTREENLTALQRRIFNEAEEATLYNGHTISMHDKVNAVVIASTSNRDQSFHPHTEDILKLASFQFHQCYLALSNFVTSPVNSSLTAKEQEILKWVAQGLTKNEVADKIIISTHTVDYHMRNILKKMDAKNATNALIIAINKGAISI